MDLLSFQKAYTESLQYYDQNNLKQAISKIEPLLNKINLHDYMLLKQPIIPKALVVECLYNMGVFYKEQTERLIKNNTNENKSISEDSVKQLQLAMDWFKKVLSINPEHENSLTNIVSILTILCSYFSDDFNLCIGYLQECLFYQPTNHTIHYNLGLMYQKTNKLENSIIHYKLSIELCKSKSKNETELNNNTINCLFGISSVYCSIKEWTTALQFLLSGLKINSQDPDINNQLGVVYTELRRTDLALSAYNTALTNYKKSVVTNDFNRLLSNIYVNMGHMCSYNGSPILAIEMYNRSLAVNNKSVFALQNKLLNLNYVNQDNPLTNLTHHKLINDIYPKKMSYQYPSLPNLDKEEKINIGFVSADFLDHPVSYFIRPILKNLDRSKFNLFCYSENLVYKNRMFSDLNLRITKYKSTLEVSEMIQNDNIHILFDLSGHTSGNRLDVFSQKPAPIQITYIGYPNTTGLHSMDYRLTDKYCDDNIDSFSEVLLKLENSFLCYEPSVTPELTTQQPLLKNGYLTFGCFNRLNKVSKEVIDVCNSLLKTIPNSQFIFKTKALLNKKVRDSFLAKFGDHANRVKILDCTNTHEEHLRVYNEIDIAIDTFPYSGTTTSCEALMMGVPVLTLFKPNLHCHNVTSSLLKNSDLEFYVCDSPNEFVEKVSTLLSYDTNTFWKTLKQHIRDKFLNGEVCNQENFIKNFENTILSLLG